MTHQLWRSARLPFQLFIVGCLLVWGIALANVLGMIGHPFAGFRFEPTLTISAVNEGSWNGIKAGLQQYDRIIEVNGRTISKPGELKEIVRNSTPGTVLNYTVLRGEQFEKKHFSIAVQKFGFLDFTRSFLPLFLIGILHLAVGIWVFLVRPEHPTARALLLMTGATSLFCVCGCDYDTAMWFDRLNLIALALLGSTTFHLGMVFPEPRPWVVKRPLLQYLAYLPVLLIVPAWEMVYRPLGHSIAREALDANIMFQNISTLWFGVGLLLLIGFIIHAGIKGTPVVKHQVKIAIMGAAIAYLPGVLFWIVPTAFGVVLDTTGLLVNLLLACFVFFPLAIAYAIVRHRLFDIDLVIKKTMVYASLTPVLVACYLLVAVGLRLLVSQLMGTHTESVGNLLATATVENLLATAVVAVAFAPLRDRIQALVDRLFFRNRYDFRQILGQFNRQARETLELDVLLDSFSLLVQDVMHPKHLSLFMRAPNNPELRLHTALGESPWKERHVLALPVGGLQSNGTAPMVDPAILSAPSEELCIPIEVSGDVLGLVNLGEKRSELDYSSEDRFLLQSMIMQLASSIKVAHMAKDLVQKERLDQELETARAIQTSMLPESAPEMSGVDIVGSSESALEVGGDYYDIIALDDHRMAIAVGDVAGKGVNAAMIMAMTKSCLYNQTRSNPEVTVVMEALNRMIIETVSVQKQRRTTFLYAILDTQARTLTYACAGHQPPHYFNVEKGACEALPIPGSYPLGVRANAAYNAVTVSLNPGDRLVFYTDGVTEAVDPDGNTFYRINDVNGEEVEIDLLRETIEQNKDATAADLRSAIRRRIAEFVDGGPQTDDITMVVAGILNR